MAKKTKKRFFLDYGILIPYLILSVLGVVMVYSATAYRLITSDPPQPDTAAAAKQALYLALGLILMVIIYQMKTKFLQSKGLLVLGIAVISTMLLLTRFTKTFSLQAGGAQGWFQLGPITLQPVEFLKIMVIWYLAYILSRRQDTIVHGFKQAVLKPVLLVSSLIFLVLIQPDTGGAAILVLLVIIMLLASGVSYWYGIVIGVGGVSLSFIAIELVSLLGPALLPENKQYIVERFLVMRNPFIDAYGSGLQMVHSYYAMFNGGLFGRGLGNSIQKKGFLPVAESDFMFSIVIEELGLIVAMLILLLLFFLILRIIMVGIRATHPFNSLMCIGIGGMLLVQTFVNIGGITGIIPLTGVTFPFLSQGGSSLLALSIGVGFVLNIRADELRKKYQRQAEVVIPMKQTQ
ncbi:FtsW/RodA/SpoVE family cell cycle protein [Vagococcus elongatus]|uniref:Probable peptidoglycan glycosyltransferase FtsW n=1 Tax=Vagococcus elongatus TaxID=180344 RepID=A0A430B222_9ENTE|nr:FtsW/RodA/SpoVE family cell cycle protein [Vagococcus elongatus]RSU14375.1 cell division protein FtsW [Vagococcus elongatus]